jgi:hypothetical protein
MQSHSSSSVIQSNQQKVGSQLATTRLVRLDSLLVSFDEMMWVVKLYDLTFNKLLWTCKLPEMAEPKQFGFGDTKNLTLLLSAQGTVVVCKNILGQPINKPAAANHSILSTSNSAVASEEQPAEQVLQLHCWIIENGFCTGKITSAELIDTDKLIGPEYLYFIFDSQNNYRRFDLDKRILNQSEFFDSSTSIEYYDSKPLNLHSESSFINGLSLKTKGNELWVEDFNIPSQLLSQLTKKMPAQSALFALKQRELTGNFFPKSIARALQIKHVNPQPLSGYETDVKNGIARCGKYAAVLHASNKTLTLCDLNANQVVWTTDISNVCSNLRDQQYHSYSNVELSISNTGNITLHRKNGSVVQIITRDQTVFAVNNCNTSSNSLSLIGNRIFKIPQGYILRGMQHYRHYQPDCKLEEIYLDQQGNTNVHQTWDHKRKLCSLFCEI